MIPSSKSCYNKNEAHFCIQTSEVNTAEWNLLKLILIQFYQAESVLAAVRPGQLSASLWGCWQRRRGGVATGWHGNRLPHPRQHCLAQRQSRDTTQSCDTSATRAAATATHLKHNRHLYSSSTTTQSCPVSCNNSTCMFKVTAPNRNSFSTYNTNNYWLYSHYCQLVPGQS